MIVPDLAWVPLSMALVRSSDDTMSIRLRGLLGQEVMKPPCRK